MTTNEGSQDGIASHQDATGACVIDRGHKPRIISSDVCWKLRNALAVCLTGARARVETHRHLCAAAVARQSHPFAGGRARSGYSVGQGSELRSRDMNP
jgi:hypothetical protein